MFFFSPLLSTQTKTSVSKIRPFRWSSARCSSPCRTCRSVVRSVHKEPRIQLSLWLWWVCRNFKNLKALTKYFDSALQVLSTQNWEKHVISMIIFPRVSIFSAELYFMVTVDTPFVAWNASCVFPAKQKSLALTFTRIPPPAAHLEGWGLGISLSKMSSAAGNTAHCFRRSVPPSGEFLEREEQEAKGGLAGNISPYTANWEPPCQWFNRPVCCFHYAEMGFAFLRWLDPSLWARSWFEW